MTRDIFYSHGKFLLTGEYLVLRGALALALPLKLGQSLSIHSARSTGQGHPTLQWKSYQPQDQLWFQANFDLVDFHLLASEDPARAQKLQQIFNSIRKLKPDFLSEAEVVEIHTSLEFDRHWGLGSSSTLIANLAKLAKLDPFVLLEHTFGGSGYDVACAGAAGPILYQRREGRPHVKALSWKPSFSQNLYFLYLGQKQDSQREVRQFQDQPVSSQDIDEISRLTLSCIEAQQLHEFGVIIQNHEAVLARILQRPTVQQNYFSDFGGIVKSLGAWGGDFALIINTQAMSETELYRYFQSKGLEVIFRYDQIIL